MRSSTTMAPSWSTSRSIFSWPTSRRPPRTSDRLDDPGHGRVVGAQEGVGAAVDDDEGAAEEAGVRTEEKGDDVRDLFGRSGAADGDREAVDERTDHRVVACCLEQWR